MGVTRGFSPYTVCSAKGLWRTTAFLFLIGISLRAQTPEEAWAPGHLYTPPKQNPALRSAPSAASRPRSLPLLELTSLAPDTISQLSQPPHESRVGVNRPVPAFDASSGQWWTSADGTKVWSLQIRSLGATGLRLHFKHFDAGAGALWVFDPNQVDSAVAYTAKGPRENGEF